MRHTRRARRKAARARHRLALAAFTLLFAGLPTGFPSTAAAQQALLDSEGALLETEVAVYDAVAGRDEAAAFRFAWLSGAPVAWRLAPMAGVMVTNEGSLYGYGGVYFDLDLPGKLFLMPSFAPGLYSAGNGPDLGHTLEFRSGAILGMRLSGGRRVGISFHHVSNGHLGRRNPGAETLGLTMTIPLDR